MTKTGNLQIHTENILPIIKKWLYSDRDIFVRELVSNACDAIQKVRVLRDKGETTALDEEFRIDITVDKEKGTLTFQDTGIGMDQEEVEKYIAQVAFSGAEDFVKKYSSEHEKDQIIGHFGLGFYSSYMVASKVELDTLSYKQDAKPVFWSCDGSTEYSMDDGSSEKRGTKITLFVDKENEEFLEESRISEILKRYCSFLPYPIYLNGTHINTQYPLWVKSTSECKEEEYKELFQHLYPMEEEPLFWVHLNVDFPFNLKGILYFTKWKKQFDLNKSNISLYCNRVFVSDHAQDIIPDYLMLLKGVIDSPDIPLNVSRSSLQMDRTVKQLATHISKKVADKIASLHRMDREQFIKCWPDIEIVAKLGAMQDDKFYKSVKNCLIWKNLNDEWVTIDEYLERHKDSYGNKIFYTLDDQFQASVLELYKSKGVEVLRMNDLIDSGVINFLERELSTVKFQRVDGAIDDIILDNSREDTVLDAEGKTHSAKIAELVREKLAEEGVEVEAKSLNSDQVPGFVVVDEQGRRLRDYMARMGPAMGGMDMGKMLGKKTLVVNTNHSLIQSLEKISSTNPELAQDLVKHVYELALLSQKELPADQMGDFLSRSHRVMAAIAQFAS